MAGVDPPPENSLAAPQPAEPGYVRDLGVQSMLLNLRGILFVVGALLVILAFAMLVPMAMDIAMGSGDWQAFAVSAAITLFFGVSLLLTCHQTVIELTVRQTFVLTTLAWVAIAFFASLPLHFSTLHMTETDAFFEAMSGLTTTGSTVLTDLDLAPPGVLLWRSLLQWVGGIGIIVMGIAVLPFLRIGGMQLFRSESSDRSDKVVPRVSDLAVALGILYVALTLLCFGTLMLFGMSTFDAANHAMTAVSTGGFSTEDASIGHYDSAAIRWILVAFMFAGALPFVRYISFVRGRYDAFWRDSQVRAVTAFLILMSFGLALWLIATTPMTAHESLLHATFNVVSIVTTTGYATADYTLWGAPVIALFLMLTMVGGCTGSTAGGVKIFRFEVLWMTLRTQVNRLFSPHKIQPLRYNSRPVGVEVLLSVTGFLFVFGSALLLFTFILGVTGLDLVTAMSAAATALANVGPGLGPIIGPAGNFATLPDISKWILTLAMLLGRLEFFTVLVLLHPDFWRN